MAEDIAKYAYITPCRTYRYTLTRGGWNKSLPSVNFVGLNPSTADEEYDDRTTSRLIGFAKELGFGSYELTNLFACRDPASKTLFLRARDIDIVGDENKSHLIDAAKNSKISVLMWGNDGNHQGRANEVLELLKPHAELFCFHKNNNGTPRHPLYLPYGTKLKPY